MRRWYYDSEHNQIGSEPLPISGSSPEWFTARDLPAAAYHKDHPGFRGSSPDGDGEMIFAPVPGRDFMPVEGENMNATIENLEREALAYAKCWLDWFNERHTEFYRGADIYRREDGAYRLISSGAYPESEYHTVSRNLSADMFGDVDVNTTPEELAKLLVETGYMKEMMGEVPA